jgi:hypothetical protein
LGDLAAAFQHQIDKHFGKISIDIG